MENSKEDGIDCDFKEYNEMVAEFSTEMTATKESCDQKSIQITLLVMTEKVGTIPVNTRRCFDVLLQRCYQRRNDVVCLLGWVLKLEIDCGVVK